MDLDGDGYISMYEMEYFYEEQMQKMEAVGIERLPFEDCLCQVVIKDLKQPFRLLRYALQWIGFSYAVGLCGLVNSDDS